MLGCKIKLFTLLCLITCSFVVKASNRITAINVLSLPESIQVTFELDNAPTYSYFRLSSPLRLVLDLSDSQLTQSLESLKHDTSLIQKIRLSKPKNSDSTRIVFELTRTVKLKIFPVLANHFSAKTTASKLVVELLPLTPIQGTPSQIKSTRLDKPTSKKEVVVAVVAGHGGNDPGSIGTLGSYEKNITLAIASKLVASINNHSNMQGVMVRNGDYYVTHANKPRIARQNKADLLISIHADAYTSPEPNGASVLVQSYTRAESQLYRLITNRQKESELVGGAGKTTQNTDHENLAITQAYLKKDFTMKRSYEFATLVLQELKTVTRLHKSKPQGLSLGVLKAPDIPSVLIETGFISNLKDEKNLINPQYQQKLVNAIFMAISRYFYPTNKSTSRFSSYHKVKAGDTLYAIAKRFNLTVAVLKQANHLQSNTLLINQTLGIPLTQ
jgi:N-acetylmuramoyl-L-alanine amidase